MRLPGGCKRGSSRSPPGIAPFLDTLPFHIGNLRQDGDDKLSNPPADRTKAMNV
jgi:hypothetical protein